MPFQSKAFTSLPAGLANAPPVEKPNEYWPIW